MSLLCDREWKLKYTPDDGNLVTLFYVPVLECAVRLMCTLRAPGDLKGLMLIRESSVGGLNLRQFLRAARHLLR